jgi:hypothetical protein
MRENFMFDKIFSGNQQRQVAVKTKVSRAVLVLIIRELICLRSSECPIYIYIPARSGCRNVGFYGHLTRLIAREDFIEFSPRESYRSNFMLFAFL